MHLIPAHIAVSFILSVVGMYLPVMVRSLGYRPSLVGITLAVSEIAGILGPFLICRFTDRTGKYKRSLIFSAILYGLPALPLALFGYPVLSAIFVAIIAVGYRSSMPLVEAVTTIYIGEKGNFGRIRVFGSIAYLAFALFMQWVPVLKPETAWNIACWLIFTSIFLIIVMVFLPSRLIDVQSKDVKKPDNSSNATTGEKSIWTRVFILGLICIGLNRLAIAPVYSFLSLFIVEYMQWNAVGLVWALGAASEIPLIYISHRIIRRFGAIHVLAFTSIVMAVRLFLYAVFPFKAGIILAQLLHSFCFGLFHPAAIAFISESVPVKQRSFGITIYLSLGNSLPTLIGNFAGGFIVEYAGYRALFGSFAIFPILSVLIYFAGRSKKIFA